MTTSRRQFLVQSLATGTLAGLGIGACTSPQSPGNKSPNSSSDPTGTSGPKSAAAGASANKAGKKRILILGGTGFLGPALIEATLARGHLLTLFNSGRTEARRKDVGRPSVIPAGVELLVGNRDPNKTADDRRLKGDPDAEAKRDPNSPRGLTQLEGKSWDAVIDTSGYFPRMVRASAELLGKSVGQYIFISSISVYKGGDVVGIDESAELEQLKDPNVEDFGKQYQNYGGGKAACEGAAEAAMPGRTTNIRPGFIVGRRDTSRRWLYWPTRVADGGEMLVPGTPDDPIQIIDVRDLAEWIVHCIEANVVGVFNASGPASKMTMRAMLDGCRAAAGTDTTFTWADNEFLKTQKIAFPIYAPPTGDTAMYHQVNISRALASGLQFRPIEDTARDTLAWHGSLPPDLQKKVLPPAPTREREAEVLKAVKGRA